MSKKLAVVAVVLLFGLTLGGVPQRAVAAGVVGNGTPASCTEAAFTAALVSGGTVTFNCGAAPHTIPITTTKRISANTFIDGGGLISLGGGTTSPAINVISGVTLNMLNITVRDTGPADFSIGTTLSNNGTTNFTNVSFINNNYISIRNSNGTVSITNGYFEDNTSSGFGGAITNEGSGTLTIRDSTFVNNRAPNSYVGGAIYNSNQPARVDIFRSTFTNNTAGTGGALGNYGTMNVYDSLLTANDANNGQSDGGAVFASSSGELNLFNTTISGNRARRGGGIYATGTIAANAVTLTNVTLANNTAPADAAGVGGANLLVGSQARITLRNTIVANPAGGGSNCKIETTGSATFVDGGNNLQFPNTTCGASITSADPKLAPLADNGGLTQTHALAADSPARNPNLSGTPNANCPAADQRGVARPQDSACDIGAFEYGAVPVLSSVNIPCGPTIGATFTISVAGSNFIAGAKGSRIVVNGTEVPTTFVLPNQLRAVVPSGLITGAPGSSIPVKVRTPVVDGGDSVERALVVCYTSMVPLVNK